MKKISILMMALSGMFSMACSPKSSPEQSVSNKDNAAYEKSMGEAFSLFKQGKLERASLVFERIAQVEKGNWIPSYYAAHTNILQVFATTDKSKGEELLQRAEKYLKQAQSIAPRNSEVETLQGVYYTAKIVLDPMVNGMKFSAPALSAFEKAKQLDPSNPRPVYLAAQFQINASKFMGGDPASYCAEIKRVIPMFDAFSPKQKFAPRWGKEQALKVLRSSPCK